MLKRTSPVAPCLARRVLLLTGMVLLGAVGCASQPAPPIAGPFDGLWTSPQLGYDVLITGKVGRAVQSGNPIIHADDVVFQLLTLDKAMRFTARQFLPDGAWHEVTGELRPDGTLHCSDGKTNWIMERKLHHEIG